MAAGEITIDEASRIARLIHDRPIAVERAPAASAADRPTAPRPTARSADVSAAPPAFDLQTARDEAAQAAAPAAPPRPANRHERRRAAALQRAPRAATASPAPVAAAA
jgi:hypothetical protein